MAASDPRPSKAEIRRWLKRVREDVRDLERALQDDDAERAIAFAEDLSGSGSEIQTQVWDRYPDDAEAGPLSRYTD